MSQEEQESYIGLILRTLRLRRGWDQTALAAASGLSQAHIAGIEVGRYRNPDILTVAKLARALEVSVGELFPGEKASGEVEKVLEYWQKRGIPSPEEEELLSLLRHPRMGKEARRQIRLLKLAGQAEERKPRKKNP